MRKTFAIASLAVRNAVRSHVVITLLAALLAAIVGIPLTVKGDGTLAGHVQIVIGYALGLAGLILSLATVWAGCAAVSSEIHERQLQLVVTKPVHRFQIWLGKWLGLVAVNAALLAISGATVYALLQWTLRPSRIGSDERRALDEEVLVARAVIQPNLPDISSQVSEEFAKATAEKSVPPNVPRDQVVESIRRAVLTQKHTARSGERIDWQFDLPAYEPDAQLTLRFKLSPTFAGVHAIRGRWEIRERGSQNILHGFFQESLPGAIDAVSIPAATLGNARHVTVSYANVNQDASTVVFPHEDGVQMLVRHGSFEANLIRSLLILLCNLSFLAALGVTAGSLFSMPVASFVAFCFLVFIRASDYISSMAGQTSFFMSHHGVATAPGLRDVFFRAFFIVMKVIVGPLRTASPLDLLATGRLVEWTWLLHVFLVRTCVYCIAMAIVGSLVLNRREIALPS